jgi:hypothetical protein
VRNIQRSIPPVNSVNSSELTTHHQKTKKAVGGMGAHGLIGGGDWMAE